ncbi:MAG: diguanylate cyclase domain-containing protein [Planctomycetota bacterium]
MRILIAEDDRIVRELLTAITEKWGFEPVAVADGAAAWQVIDENPPEFALLDWVMPGVEGPELCRRIRGLEGADYIYTVLLTSREGAEDVITGLNAGADDFLAKPPKPPELRARLRAGERVLRLRAELAEARRMLGDAGAIDDVTQLPLPRIFNRSLEAELARSQRAGHAIGLVLLEIDGYEALLERHGPRVCQRALVEVADALRRSTRVYDLLARYSITKFFLALPETTAQQARQVAERVRDQLADSPTLAGWAGDPAFGVSVGATAVRPGMTDTTDDLVDAAADALDDARRHANADRVEQEDPETPDAGWDATPSRPACLRASARCRE